MRARTEISKSGADPESKTQGSRQAYFLKFLLKHKIEPRMWLGNGKLWTDLVSLYAVDIIGGNNINQLELRAQTIREYLAEVNNLFSSRGY